MIKQENKPLFGIWTPFIGIRHKEYYDVMTYSGSVFTSLFPNVAGWHQLDDNDVEFKKLPGVREHGYLLDEYVVAVRLLTDEEIIARQLPHLTGAARIKRLKENGSFDLATVTIEKSKMIKDNELRELINDVTKIAIEFSQCDSVREKIGKRIKKTVLPFNLN